MTARAITSDIAASMGRFEYGLRGIAAARDGLPTLAQVKRYARTHQVDKQIPGAHAFGLIWRVAPADVSVFTAGVRADGDPALAIRNGRPPTACRHGECLAGVVSWATSAQAWPRGRPTIGLKGDGP